MIVPPIPPEEPLSHKRYTTRGFAVWTFYNYDYANEAGYDVTVQESSLADERKVWVGPEGGPRMHLSVRNARKLRDILTEWLEDGQHED